MDLNRLTQKSQEAITAAQTRAAERGHQQVDVEHLLAALLAQPEGLVPRLLARVGAEPAEPRGERRIRPGEAAAGRAAAAPKRARSTSHRGCRNFSASPRAKPSGSRTSTSRSST